MEQLTLDELAIRADSILVGEVTDITAYQEENGNIYTLATISVEQTVKGQTRDKATLRTLGGELDGQVMWVEGTPGFQPGERVVVFLKKGGGAFTIIGGFQGKFIIDGNDMVSGNIPLTEFTQQIRDILIEQ